MSEKAVGLIASGAAERSRPLPAKPGAPDGKIAPRSGNNSPVATVAARAVELDALVDELNRASDSIGRSIRFRVNPESTTPIIQVLDRDTGKLIRQIPADQGAVLANNLDNLSLDGINDIV